MRSCNCEHEEILPVLSCVDKVTFVDYWFCFSCGFRVQVLNLLKGFQWII